MKKHQVSILISLICICGTVYQNYRLSEMYDKSTGKTRALFGITELAQLDIKIWLGSLAVIGLVFGISALRKNENSKYSIISIIFSAISITLLFIRFWTWMI